MSSPSSALRALVDIHPGERRLAAAMCTYFFLVITSFWILKPLKKTLFIGHYAESGFDALGRSFSASEAELLAKVLNMVVAGGAAFVFARLARSLRRERLSMTFTLFFMAAYGVFALALAKPTGLGVWAFYLFGDLFSTLMVAAFFAFLNDSVSSDAAKRLYGVVGFGGVAGGAFGSTVVATWIGSLTLGHWLFVAGLLGVLILAVASGAARELRRAGGSGAVAELVSRQAESPTSAVRRGDAEGASQDGVGGVGLVLRSSYLLSLVAIVGLYELVSTLVDFQFTTGILELARSDAERDRAFATVYATTNWLSMGIQLFATSFVLRRFGMTTALLVLPGTIALASLAFSARPTLALSGALSVADNAFSYSIHQSAKETLYVPTTAREKYQAKAVIDMFVQRFAKALAVGVGLVASRHFGGAEGVRLLSFVVLPLLVLWALAALHAGRRFHALEARTTTLGSSAE